MQNVNLKITFLLYSLLFLSLNGLAQIQDSTQKGIIRIRKTVSPDTLEAAAEKPRDLMHEGNPAMLLRRRGGLYRHGPLLGIDLLQDFGYRAGFQYSTTWLSTAMCFRHFPANKLAGISANFDFPISSQRLRLGTEWTSMGQVNAWYHGVSIQASTIFPSHRKYWPNVICKAGYSFRVNNELDGVPLNNGFVFSLHLHL